MLPLLSVPSRLSLTPRRSMPIRFSILFRLSRSSNRCTSSSSPVSFRLFSNLLTSANLLVRSERLSVFRRLSSVCLLSYILIGFPFRSLPLRDLKARYTSEVLDISTNPNPEASFDVVVFTMIADATFPTDSNAFLKSSSVTSLRRFET